MSTTNDEEQDLEEISSDELMMQEMEYLSALEESMTIRAMTGSSSQKLTTLDWRVLFILR
jgi:hypothetical protein